MAHFLVNFHLVAGHVVRHYGQAFGEFRIHVIDINIYYSIVRISREASNAATVNCTSTHVALPACAATSDLRLGPS